MENESIAHIGSSELYWMNSFFRKALMKLYEFPLCKRIFKQNKIILHEPAILDAGCGNGYSTKLISQYFHPSRLDAFDILPEQIVRTKNQHITANFFIGDVTQIDKAQETYDAAFIFGILHHVPGWRQGISEIFRVLKKGGIFYVEEPMPTILEHAEQHHHLNHPKDARFSVDEIKSALECAGFRIITQQVKAMKILMIFLVQKP